MQRLMTEQQYTQEQLGGRRQGKLPDFPHQPQDGDRQLSERAAKAGKMRDCTLFCEAKWGAVPVFFEGRMVN
jgi:hypothetical protein